MKFKWKPGVSFQNQYSYLQAKNFIQSHIEIFIKDPKNNHLIRINELDQLDELFLHYEEEKNYIEEIYPNIIL